MNSSRSSKIHLASVAESELSEIGAMAAEIWPDAYAGIISDDQIAHMLDMMYSPNALKRDLAEGGIEFRRIEGTDACHGFVGFGPVLEGKPVELHKFYLRDSARGQGIASDAMGQLVAELADRRVSEIRLRVNRHNQRAIRFYQKMNFRIDGEDCLDIGSGFVMDDYLMSRELD